MCARALGGADVAPSNHTCAGMVGRPDKPDMCQHAGLRMARYETTSYVKQQQVTLSLQQAAAGRVPSSVRSSSGTATVAPAAAPIDCTSRVTDWSAQLARASVRACCQMRAKAAWPATSRRRPRACDSWPYALPIHAAAWGLQVQQTTPLVNTEGQQCSAQ